MPAGLRLLSWGIAKQRLADQLGSAATKGEGRQNMLCAYLAGALLVGLLGNAVAGAWWLDPTVGLLIAAVAVKEGAEAWRGEGCCVSSPLDGSGFAADRRCDDDCCAPARGDGDLALSSTRSTWRSPSGCGSLIQLRRTGSTGFHGVGGRPGSAEWVAGVGFTVALLVGAAAPLLALLDLVEPIGALDVAAVHAAGIVLAVAGIAATFYAQVAMGASWRIGVDPGERTQLVTSGPFALVRNPIFAAMLPTALGLTLMVPSWVAFVGLVGLSVALELQVRVVEEPYLL